MTQSITNSMPFLTRGFLITLLINGVWINSSEIFRYFVFVMPMMRETFPQISDVAPMTFKVFLIWGIWDTVLLFVVTGFVWLYLERFGVNITNAVLAGTLAWLSTFGIFWLGLYNMNLATLSILSIALPLSWLELAIGALIVNWGMKRFS